MKLENATRSEIKISLTPEEFDFLKGQVEHAAEISHEVCFVMPGLLEGFRQAKETLNFYAAEGAFDELEELPY